MVGMLVPVKGGIGGIVHPPIGRKNTTYIPLIVLAFWGVICYRSHLLQEPETTIDATCYGCLPVMFLHGTDLRGLQRGSAVIRGTWRGTGLKGGNFCQHEGAY